MFNTENNNITSESIVRMDGSFYKPHGGNTKFIRKIPTGNGISKSNLLLSLKIIAPVKENTLIKVKSGTCSPNMTVTRNKSYIDSNELNMMKNRSDSVGSNNNSCGNKSNLFTKIII